MSPDSTPSLGALPRTLGHYTFTECVGVHTHHEFYRARQDEVEREVVVELLRESPDGTSTSAQSFHNSVKARAHMNLPRMMQVYESVQMEQHNFVAYQLPQGVALSELAEQHETLSVLSICRIIEQCATLYQECEKNDLRTRVLNSDMIFRESEESFYFLSPLCASCHASEVTSSFIPSMQALAEALIPLLPEQVEGASRTITLISWLQEGYQGSYLDWQSIRATALDLIEQVLPNWQHSEVANAMMRSKAARDRYQARARKQQAICYALIAICTFISLISLYQIFDEFSDPDNSPPPQRSKKK